MSKFRRTRIMLRISGRFLPPQTEEEEEEAAAAAEGEHDADDDAVCRSIRPTMSGRARRPGEGKLIDNRHPQAAGSETGDGWTDGWMKRELARGDGTRPHG